MASTAPMNTALITGASSGFGAEFARQLAGRGHNLILTARRVDRLEALRDEISARMPVQIDVIPLDLGERGAPQRLFDGVLALGREVDVLVNNAGFGLHGTVLELPLERQSECIDLNIRAVFELSRLFAPPMVARDRGRIVLLGSIAGFQPSPTYAVYAASKTFVDSFGAALDYELQGSGVTVTTVCPGPSPTEFAQVADQGRALLHMGEMAPDAVVRAALDAAFAGKRRVVPGWVNSAMTSLSGWAPRSLAIWSAQRLSRD